MRLRAGLAALLTAATLVLVPSTTGAAHQADQSHQAHRERPELRRCGVVAGALCGSIEREWEPGDPAAGTVTVGFAFVPARDRSRPALGTLVPHEGGPGYATTGTAASYAAMYGPLLRRRNLLLVDQRGTGRSEPVHCPALQDLRQPYADAAAECGASLGDRADDYTTALSADDVAAVVEALGLGRVDLYGDSYGTFFTQVFAGRHPDLVRSIVLDSAYPVSGETAWYPTQGPAVRRAFSVVCRRSPECRRSGQGFVRSLDRVLDRVRVTPWRGTSHDADGRRVTVTVDGPGLVAVAYGATYTPAWYRELTAALRSGLAGDHAPLLRLVAEATGGGTYAGPPSAYSEGLDAAVACHDYPQLYDMTAVPAVRREQYAAALLERQRTLPETYGPFTVREYADSDWQSLDWCTDWPVAPASDPAGPPTPPSGRYPDVPVLVLTGELDTITTAAEANLVAAEFPHTQRVLVANSFHVTALEDTDDCAQRLVRAFVTAPGARLDRRCAARVAPVRALGRFPGPVDRSTPARGVVRAATLTVADLQGRWYNNYSGHGVGLHGGRYRYTGYDVVRFELDRYRLADGLAVSGRARWDRLAGTMTVDLSLARGHLTSTWATRTPGATAAVRGRLDGRSVRLTVPAP